VDVCIQAQNVSRWEQTRLLITTAFSCGIPRFLLSKVQKRLWTLGEFNVAEIAQWITVHLEKLIRRSAFQEIPLLFLGSWVHKRPPSIPFWTIIIQTAPSVLCTDIPNVFFTPYHVLCQCSTNAIHSNCYAVMYSNNGPCLNYCETFQEWDCGSYCCTTTHGNTGCLLPRKNTTDRFGLAHKMLFVHATVLRVPTYPPIYA
jgi:hypothetical protein